MNPTSAPFEKPARLVSLDAYRGFIMLAMASSFGGALKKFAENAGGLTGDPLYESLAYQFDHVLWTGCSFWDLIQPSFMFMVGVAMPYSYASRKAKGDSDEKIFVHVLIRAIVLILLGIFLSSNGKKETNYTFVNVLTQIGLGYTFVYLLVGRGLKLQLAGSAAILIGYWALFAAYPFSNSRTTRPEQETQLVFLSTADVIDWDEIEDKGFFAHWEKNKNFAAWFDRGFLNLFPRSKPFEDNEGGYQTLNFVPSMVTILFGLMAGELLRSSRSSRKKFIILVAAGVFCLGLGLLLNYTVCPSVKRIWTPSWAIYSSGWTFLMLAAFYGIIDIAGFRAWSFPLVVVGMNSIAMYCMAQLLGSWTRQTLETHLGSGPFSGVYGPLISMAAVLGVYWLICFWMYRQRIFIRI